MVHSDLTVIEKAEIEGVGDIAPPPATGALSGVGDEEPQVAMFLESKTVAAVIKLRGYDDTYLYVARPLDPRVIEQLQATQESVAEFANLEARRVGVQVAFALMYTVIALIVLLVRGVDRTELRQPAGRADPPPDRRRQPGLDRQSLCAGAGAARGGRPLASSARPSTR